MVKAAPGGAAFFVSIYNFDTHPDTHLVAILTTFQSFLHTEVIKQKQHQTAKLRNLALLITGGPEEARTPDLCVANAALSQLSYKPVYRGLHLCSQ